MLTALHEGDLVYGIDIATWSEVSDLPRFKIEATPSTGYVDIGSDDIKTGNNIPGIAKPSASPIKLWNRYGRNLGYDYVYVNDQIKAYAVEEIENYTAEEQEIFAEHHIFGINDLLTVYPFEQVVAVSLNYFTSATAARKRRVDVASMFLQAAIGDVNAKIVGEQVIGILALYIQQNDSKIIDFCNSAGLFTGSGLLDQGFASQIAGKTMMDIRDEIKSYFQYGTKLDGSPYFPV